MLLSLCAVAGFAAPPFRPRPQFAKPEDAIRYRQSAYVLMGNHMGRINNQLKADKPDVAADPAQRRHHRLRLATAGRGLHRRIGEGRHAADARQARSLHGPEGQGDRQGRCATEVVKLDDRLPRAATSRRSARSSARRRQELRQPATTTTATSERRAARCRGVPAGDCRAPASAGVSI
ncbi:MAG: hypothetical protein MZW92_35415 [Comamonadaceae bacterium]|nr:hypothetical protein [Comamonadaceae bacterium]